MGTKKADRSSISKLEIGSETVMGDSRSAQNPKEEEEVEGGRQRASGEGGKEGRPPARFTERAGVCLSVRLQQPSVCVCEPPPASVFRGTGTAGSMGERRFTHPSFPTLRSNSLPHDEYIATAAGVVCGKLRGREGTTRKDFI